MVVVDTKLWNIKFHLSPHSVEICSLKISYLLNVGIRMHGHTSADTHVLRGICTHKHTDLRISLRTHDM